MHLLCQTVSLEGDRGGDGAPRGRSGSGSFEAVLTFGFSGSSKISTAGFFCFTAGFSFSFSFSSIASSFSLAFAAAAFADTRPFSALPSFSWRSFLACLASSKAFSRSWLSLRSFLSASKASPSCFRSCSSGTISSLMISLTSIPASSAAFSFSSAALRSFSSCGTCTESVASCALASDSSAVRWASICVSLSLLPRVCCSVDSCCSLLSSACCSCRISSSALEPCSLAWRTALLLRSSVFSSCSRTDFSAATSRLFSTSVS
mmetsp:Transcript_3886/g.9287  ORF Transcript_3886/g.9287 Transcript_3886/m.9287 type:complete len:262 (+) Transcript_3886:1513-2298(+)